MTTLRGKDGWLLCCLALALLTGCEEATAESCADTSSGDRAFGECCTEASQCADGVCHEFGDGTVVCTKKCTTASDCPSGTQGQKCNNQGVCRY